MIGTLEDSIHYQIDKIETRKLDLAIDTTRYSLGKNVEIDGLISFSPSQVTVKGPSSLLDDFGGKFYVAINENRISQNFQKSVNLEIEKKLADFISLEEESVEVSFSVIQYLEGNKRLKIKKINFPRSVTLEDEELTPMITYLIDASKVTEIKDVEFDAILDYGKRNRKDSTISIEVRPNPSYIKEIKVEPAFVKLKYE